MAFEPHSRRTIIKSLQESITNDDIVVNQSIPNMMLNLFAYRIDPASASTTYVGYGQAGTLNATAGWAIMRIDVTAGITSIEWADGDTDFDNIWNNRASLSYS